MVPATFCALRERNPLGGRPLVTIVPPSRTGAQILVEQLSIHGVDLVFGVPGESYLAVLDALHDAVERMRFIVCRHEAGAANMADAYGKLTGKPGICMVTRGPGATHAAVGLHTAFQDSTPMILFIGQVAPPCTPSARRRGRLSRRLLEEHRDTPT